MLCLVASAILLVMGCNSQRAGRQAYPAVAAAAAETSGIPADETDEDGDFLPEEAELLPADADLPVTAFGEVWTYLVAGREQALNLRFPVTDLVYFGAELDSYGKLTDIPDYRNIAAFRGRKHFVAASSGRALTHFALAEGSPERKALVGDLLEAARPYDGLQIDFEYVPARDGDVFLSFLRELRQGLGGKVFSVALPARTRALQGDVYDYEKIKPLVDRILVMAYDEHWSTSEPGPIASMGWCQRVAKHSMETVGPEKLVMGLPFYGRSWGSVTTNKAYVYSGIEDVIKEQGIKEINRENGIPTFRYETPVSVSVYYEDNYSLSARLGMYKKMGVNSVGFWRLGQEAPGFWSLIRAE
jgi:spore germination protein YaaH